jgi:ubiquinone/menaquinone biosynthesis C-methylase UbiE
MSGWQLSGDAPTAYTRYAVHILAPWTDDLIAQGSCKSGDRVLDIACGTGIVASRVNLVSKTKCKVVGIDVNEGMLNMARRNTLIEWHLGSATELPFEDGSFDVVLCQQGLQYFPDRAAAMREVARVLVPGGRVSLNVWGALDRQPFHLALVDAVGAFIGAETKTAFDLAFSLNTSDELRQLASDAGLRQVRIRFEHRTMRYPSAADLAVGFMQATPIASQFVALSEEKPNAFAAHASEWLSSYVDDAGLAAPQENHFLTAIR